MDRDLIQSLPDLDVLTIGESEETIAEIVELYYLKSMEKGQYLSRREFINEIKEIPGTLTRGSQVKPREYAVLDNLPPPDMDLLENYWKSDHVVWEYDYRLSKRRNPLTTFRGTFVGEGDWGAFEEEISVFPMASNFHTHLPFGVVMGSRGCPFHCSFCSSSGARRTHSASYIFDRIIEMKDRHGISTIAFFDSLFTTASRDEQQRVEELCKMIIEADLDIKYLIEIRTDVIQSLPEELLRLMIRSGCTQVNLGLEKGSDESLRRVMKESSIEEHFEAVEKMRQLAKSEKRNLLINGTFILGGPAESKMDVLETLLHCWRPNLDEHTLYVMNIFPGTKIYDDALEDGIIDPSLKYYLDVESFPQYGTKELSIEYLDQICELDEKTFLSMRDFKQAVFEIENQFLPESDRVIRFVEYVETAALLDSIH